MRYLLFSFLALTSAHSIAQKAVPASNYAVIKGHIDNHVEDNWDYSQVGLLKFETLSAPINKNGDFFKKIKIEGEGSEIFLRQGNGLVVYLLANDTIIVNYNDKDQPKTFSVTSPIPGKNSELKTLATLRNYYISTYSQQESLQQRNIADSTKFAIINKLYNGEIELLLSGDMYINTTKIALDIYYRYTSMLLHARLLPKYELVITRPTEKTAMVAVLNQSKAYANESVEWCKISDAYRNFVFDYVRFLKPFKSWEVIEPEKTVKSEFAWDDYYAGLTALHTQYNRDWFLTKSIMFSFEVYPFDDAGAVYRDGITKIKTPYYADTLKTFYANIQRLKPGTPAPGFTLKNDKGQQVSLVDFRGKVVYLDFWGVGCGPCIYDIKNYAPALHEKYKDKNVVFLNVCVDSDEKTWKESLGKLNLHGVNLVAMGWNKHPVAKAYNVMGIPHYYLIDVNGKIVNNNITGPGDLQGLSSQIDKLLK